MGSGIQAAEAVKDSTSAFPSKALPVMKPLHHAAFNDIDGLQTLHLHTGHFMENTFAQVGMIIGAGVMGSPLKAAIAMHIFHTPDIGEFFKMLIRCSGANFPSFGYGCQESLPITKFGHWLSATL